MDFFDLFNINNTLVNIPIGGGYALSWIEAFGTVFGLLCIWFASQEKTINYIFGLLNVTLFAVIFFQIQLYGLLILQLFFFCANIYGWYAWTRPNNDGDVLEVRWLSTQKMIITIITSVVAIALLSFYIDPLFSALANIMVNSINLFNVGLSVPTLKPDVFPFWDATMTILSMVAQVLMTRKYVENWILWILINIISVCIYATQGVYAMSIQYSILMFIAANGTREWARTAKMNDKKNNNKTRAI